MRFYSVLILCHCVLFCLPCFCFYFLFTICFQIGVLFFFLFLRFHIFFSSVCLLFVWNEICWLSICLPVSTFSMLTLLLNFEIVAGVVYFPKGGGMSLQLACLIPPASISCDACQHSNTAVSKTISFVAPKALVMWTFSRKERLCVGLCLSGISLSMLNSISMLCCVSCAWCFSRSANNPGKALVAKPALVHSTQTRNLPEQSDLLEPLCFGTMKYIYLAVPSSVRITAWLELLRSDWDFGCCFLLKTWAESSSIPCLGWVSLGSVACEPLLLIHTARDQHCQLNWKMELNTGFLIWDSHWSWTKVSISA